jgi:hypothetical protein
MTRLLAIGMIIVFSVIPHAWGQQRVNGVVTGGRDSTILTGATVYLIPGGRGTITNVQGRFRLTIAPESKWIAASYLGYHPDTLEIRRPLDENAEIVFHLEEDPVSIPAAQIVGQQGITKINNSEPGLVRIPASEIARIPSLMGERDPLSLIRNLPGVQSVGEGDGYLYVRGGNADQNLILLDGAVIYNPAHLLGLFSVINPSVVRSIDFYKGAIPASYTGRLSSVVDIRMRSGNDSVFSGEVSTGIIASRFMAEGPIAKGKASFLVAGRRTHLDLLNGLFIGKESPIRGSGFYFGDFNGRITWEPAEKQSLTLSGYYGTDDFKLNDKDFYLNATMNWGNRFLSLQHTIVPNERFTWNQSLVLSGYGFDMNYSQSRNGMGFRTGVGTATLNGKGEFRPDSSSAIGFGYEGIIYRFSPYQAFMDYFASTSAIGDHQTLRAREAAVFIQYDRIFGNLMSIQLGVRTSVNQHMGPFNRYINGPTGNIADTILFPAGKAVSTFFNADPRISVTLFPGKSLYLRSSVGYLSQPVHMVPVTLSTLPLDIWLPATSLTPPQHALSGSLGVYWSPKSAVWDGYIEGFARKLVDQVEFRDTLMPSDLVKRNLDRQMATGEGTVWGFEALLRKSRGDIRGWVGYTWSVSKRYFPEINGGVPFYSSHDRRHDLNVSLSWPMGPVWSGSLTFVYATGQAVSMPTSMFYVFGGMAYEYGSRNSYRLPAYHRMDLGITRSPVKRRKMESNWSFSIYNLYNRLNPFIFYFDAVVDEQNASLTTRARKVTLLPLVPSFSWTGRW